MKPKIYLAGPLFNGPQVNHLKRLETLMTNLGLEFYSPRLHSGSADMTPTERKHFDNWTPIFEANATALYTSDLMVAVLDYLLPESQSLHVCELDSGLHVPKFKLSLPDLGTVWEMGAYYALQKPVIGVSLARPESVNLMLSHSCASIATVEQLEKFLSSYSPYNYTLDDRLKPYVGADTWMSHYLWSMPSYEGKVV